MASSRPHGLLSPPPLPLTHLTPNPWKATPRLHLVIHPPTFAGRSATLEATPFLPPAMLITSLEFLAHSATYRELALRCQEFLYYHRISTNSDSRQLAEDMLYNLLVEYMVHAGVPREKAEDYCNNRDHLTELAMRMSSILGPVSV
jgi:hypothetical protein